ncbi:MAG: RHS repeat-associated core domain-containing protein, partial [Caldilineaceae bacterium]|nr:RHS repeat-associated core domain-containing protein [Caldilineaceae bacterium]
MPSVNTFSQPGIERRWKKSSGEPDGDAGDPYTGYDRFGRTERMRWIKGSSSLVDVQWGYNQASLKTWRRDLVAPTSADQDQSFGYDGLYQVVERKQGLLNTNATSIAGVPAQEELFSYDETGNWVQYRKLDDGVSKIDQTRVNNQSNQILQVDGLSTGVSYDANGNMLLVPTGDALEGAPRKLTWDAWNRLRTVKDSNNVTLGDYQYDAQFRRITTAANGATQHAYFNDQWRSVEERVDASTSAERQCVWHPTNRWDLILRDRSPSNNGTLSERLYSLKDQLDVVATCNSSGVTQERFSYSAFGEPTFLNAAYTVQSTSPALWTFLFHAEFGDIDTGWYNYGYRFYVPSLGRWPSRDPILEAGGQNLQAFCFSDAVNWYDVSGKNPQKPVNPRTDGD